VVAGDDEERDVQTLGLTQEEAELRLVRDGPNELPPPPRRSAATELAGQMLHFFALMLWAAAALAMLVGLPQLGIAISAVIVLNGVFAFAQERRADHAAERLRSLLPRRVTVRREGRRILVDAGDVVVGDVVLLEPGDRVPADATVAVAHSALIDTSLLTGESEPTPVMAGEPVLAGTFLVEGEAEIVVAAVGSATRLADIARLTTTTPAPTSPLTRELHRLVRVIAVIALSVGGAFLAVSSLLGNAVSDGLVFAIGVTVALVPEALLPTVTLSLAWGGEQMARGQVLVRRLDAVETLGSTTFICTDKTGTLTLNQMTLVEAWTHGGEASTPHSGYDPSAPVELGEHTERTEVERLALAAVLCSVGHLQVTEEGWQPHGDPMEVAADVFARRLGLDTDASRALARFDARFPFDPRRRRMTVVVGDQVITKGAPDAVLPLCGDGFRASDPVRAMMDRGLRVIAVAARPTGPHPPTSAAEAESGLDLLGLLGLEDPPRPDVGAALADTRLAGVKVAMITGDHPATAAAIATEVGLRRHDDPIVVGAELPVDDAALGALVDHDGIVIARVSPEDKLRIAVALRARGHVVAMTGDGVNDGPALHEADIGIAMGASGTDVAREAADLVLLDDHFASIVAGIEQGRATFLNVRRFLTYHLTDNVAELTPLLVWALSGGNIPLALGVLQILALDLGTDTLSAVALGAEPPARHTLDRPPVSGRLLNRTVVRRSFGLLGPTVALLTMTAFLVPLLLEGWRPGGPLSDGQLAAASGAAFMTVVLAQTANAFACRSSSRWPGSLGWTTNRLLIPATTIELAFSFGVVFLPPIADELGHAGPSLLGWLIAVAAPFVVLAVDALDKGRRRRD
jgi:magnesium-transporting ATPase (P-type)